MKVFFLNVGHGDCTIIEHASGRITMIDINNSQSYDDESYQEVVAEEVSKNFIATLYPETAQTLAEAEVKKELVDPIEFYKKEFGDRPIWRFILTHPDMDHMRGIKNLFQNVRVINFWDTAHTKPTPSFWSNSDKEDWEFYQALRAKTYPTINVMYYTRGDSLFAFARELDGTLGGDGIDILSPTTSLVGACNASGKSNDLSIVLRISYAGRSVIFPGDAETLAWENMVATYGEGLKSDVLKASHHGRQSGFDLAALQNIEPSMVIVSVGRKPSTDAHQRYAYHGNRVCSTRRHGTIRLEITAYGELKWVVDRHGDQ